MELHRAHLGRHDALERRHSETSLPRAQNMTPGPNFPYPHFAIMYIDAEGQLQLQASPSIAGCGDSIFTTDVTDRFIDLTGPSPQPNMHFQSHQTPPSPWGMQSSPGWLSGQSRPADLIPCEWQSHQSRRKRRDMKRTGMARPSPKSSSPPPTPPPGRTILRVGNRDLLRHYYEKAFEDFQQLNCRAIAKSYIKLVEPRKQVHFPYNGRKVISGVTQRVDPEQTKPAWWPAGVLHREPDHLLKRDRLKLLVHILCELKDSHGVTAEKLSDAGLDVRRQITPSHRLQVLDEIYFVRQMEERFLDGEIEANTLVQVSHTLLPEAIYQDEELSSHAHAAPICSLDADTDGYDPGGDTSSLADEVDPLTLPGQRGVPLSPATSESSGPRSPSTGFGPYPVSMAPSMVQQSPTPLKSVHADPGYLPGYYGQHFVPAQKNTGYWSGVPQMPSVSQYGY